ncbi:hypothetical protein ES705_41853 [subsurface metagenome]
MIFKKLGIFDENYHQKYRVYIRQKRYREYIENVKLDMYAKLFDARLKEKIKKLIKEKFGKKEFICPDIPK